MKISQKYSEWIKIGITLFVTVILYELLIVQLLGNKSYDLRVGKIIFLFSPRQQFIPVFLLSFFIVYFIGEYKYRYSRVSRNLLILASGIAILVLTFLFAGHIHRLYYTFVQKFEALPKSIVVPMDQDMKQAGLLLTARNILLAVDAVLCLCMIYLWYHWAKFPAKKSIGILLFFFAFDSQGQSVDMNKRISEAAIKVEPKVIEWRRDIHQHPELGNSEIRTAALIAKHLQDLGIDVQTGVAKTGVIGILKGGKPGPVVALRADMDALPVIERNQLAFASTVKVMYDGKESGVMHACGHDAHVAILMGVAEVLSGMKQELKGTVKFIFQPAEEGPPEGEDGGASLMVKEGVLNNPKVDVIFGLHMNAQVEAGKITYHPGGAFASVNDMKLTIKGKSSHGAEPWSSVDPIVVAAQVINSLQTIVSRNVNVIENAAAVTIGAIQGGNRTNIIPEQVEMIGTIRTLSDADEKMVVERVRQITQKTAEAAGATAVIEIPYSFRLPVTYNDPKLTAVMLPSLQKSAGADRVELVPAETGAEDFAFFAEKVPGLFFYLGALPKGKDPKTSGPHHTPDFFLDESGFVVGVKALCNLVFDYTTGKGIK